MSQRGLGQNHEPSLNKRALLSGIFWRRTGIDRDGKVVHDLFDPKGEQTWMVTSVQERAGHLYLGNAADDAWARIPVP